MAVTPESPAERELRIAFSQSLHSSSDLLSRKKITPTEFFTRISGDGTPVSAWVNFRRPEMQSPEELMVERTADRIIRIGYPLFDEQEPYVSAQIGISEQGVLQVEQVVATKPDARTGDAVVIEGDIIECLLSEIPRKRVGRELLTSLLNLYPSPLDQVAQELSRALDKNPKVDEPIIVVKNRSYTPWEIHAEVIGRSEFGIVYANQLLESVDRFKMPLPSVIANGMQDMGI